MVERSAMAMGYAQYSLAWLYSVFLNLFGALLCHSLSGGGNADAHAEREYVIESSQFHGYCCFMDISRHSHNALADMSWHIAWLHAFKFHHSRSLPRSFFKLELLN